jgi:acyl-CoA thioesterase
VRPRLRGECARIIVEAIGSGFARYRMTVRRDMVNGHDTWHGGFTFTLADAAFAYACNACHRATAALGRDQLHRPGARLILTSATRSSAIHTDRWLTTS